VDLLVRPGARVVMITGPVRAPRLCKRRPALPCLQTGALSFTEAAGLGRTGWAVTILVHFRKA
jgi:hypothetical protein